MTVDQDVASFQAMFDTNVRGTYFLTAALVPAMLANQRGSIVNVTTMAASMGVAGASGYSATKAALASFTRTWAAEFSPRGVRVNSIAPGPTRTEGVLVEWGESIEDLAQALPMARTARPAEIAEAILFLASPRSSYITGSTLAVDGGGTAVQARWGAGRRRRLPGQVHRRYTAGISEDHGIGMVAAWSAAISRAARSG